MEKKDIIVLFAVIMSIFRVSIAQIAVALTERWKNDKRRSKKMVK